MPPELLEIIINKCDNKTKINLVLVLFGTKNRVSIKNRDSIKKIQTILTIEKEKNISNYRYLKTLQPFLKRLQNSEINIQLNLTKIKANLLIFKNLNLSHSNFGETKSSFNFEMCNLTKTSFWYSIAENSKFTNCILNETNFIGASIKNSTFNDSNYKDAKILCTNIRGTIYEKILFKQ